MSRDERPTALVVYESMFGNTAQVADAVCRGLALEGFNARGVQIAGAPANGLVDADLLVVGAPTHAFTLSRPRTRRTAIEQGAPASRQRFGLREWLGLLAPISGGRLVAIFDTRHRSVQRMPASAGRTAARILMRRGYRPVDRPRGFVVADIKGPLLPGQRERAVEWGRQIGRLAQDRLALDGRGHSNRPPPDRALARP